MSIFSDSETSRGNGGECQSRAAPFWFSSRGKNTLCGLSGRIYSGYGPCNFCKWAVFVLTIWATSISKKTHACDSVAEKARASSFPTTTEEEERSKLRNSSEKGKGRSLYSTDLIDFFFVWMR